MANLSNINNILRTGSLGVGINRDPLGAFEISSATKPGVKMFNTSTNGKTYEAYSDANGNYIIYDQDADDNRFVINTSGNATFAGQVIASSSSSGDYVRMYGGSGTAQWDIYGNGENLRFSENSGGGGHVDIDTNLIVDGKVGIGTTSPSGVKFQTVQTTSGEWTGGFKNYTANGYGLRVDMSNSSSVQSALQVYTGAGTGFVVKNTGKVGIGTQVPDAKLHVVTDEERVTTFESSNSGGPYTAYYLGSTPLGFIGNAQGLANAGSTNMCIRGQSQLVFSISSTEKMRIDSSGQITNTMSGGKVLTDTNGFITSFQTLDTATAGGRYKGKSNRGLLGQMRIEQTATGADGGYITFDTSPNGSTTPTERMRIDSSGVTTFNNYIIAHNHISVKTSSASGSPYIDFLQGSTQKGYIQYWDNGEGMITQSDSAHFWWTGSVERMRISTGGYIGIANNNPASLLSVGSTSYGSNARIDCMADDSNNAEIRAFGNAQGTGVVYVGQSTTYGGGIAYNGDGSPAYGDFGNDRVTLFAREGGTSHKVADWSYSSSDKAFNFYGPIVVSGTRGSAGQVLTSNGNAQATWTTPSAGGDFKTKGVTLATVTSSGTTVATTVNASTVTNNSCGVIKFTMGHAANIIVVSFVVYETSNMWFVNRADEGANSNNDNDITYSGVATNTLTFKAENSSPSSGYNGVVMIECFPPSMFTL